MSDLNIQEYLAQKTEIINTLCYRGQYEDDFPPNDAITDPKDENYEEYWRPSYMSPWEIPNTRLSEGIIKKIIDVVDDIDIIIIGEKFPDDVFYKATKITKVIREVLSSKNAKDFTFKNHIIYEDYFSGNLFIQEQINNVEKLMNCLKNTISIEERQYVCPIYWCIDCYRHFHFNKNVDCLFFCDSCGDERGMNFKKMTISGICYDELFFEETLIYHVACSKFDPKTLSSGSLGTDCCGERCSLTLGKFKIKDKIYNYKDFKEIKERGIMSNEKLAASMFATIEGIIFSSKIDCLP